MNSMIQVLTKTGSAKIPLTKIKRQRTTAVTTAMMTRVRRFPQVLNTQKTVTNKKRSMFAFKPKKVSVENAFYSLIGKMNIHLFSLMISHI